MKAFSLFILLWTASFQASALTVIFTHMSLVMTEHTELRECAKKAQETGGVCKLDAASEEQLKSYLTTGNLQPIAASHIQSIRTLLGESLGATAEKLSDATIAQMILEMDAQ